MWCLILTLYQNTSRNIGALTRKRNGTPHGRRWRGKDRKAKRKFEIELLKYARGEPNGIKPGTDVEAKAKIAKKLVEDDPTLLLQVNRAQLRSQIKSVYDREVLRVPF